MDEQTQQQFIQWLAQKLGVSSEQELQSALEQMGEEGIQQAMAQFQQESAGQQSAAAYLNGGKLDYIKNLQSFMKGGKIKDGGKDSKTAIGGNKTSMKKDGKSAKMEGNRKEAPLKWMSAKAKK
jgi:hypothetical protein